MFGLGVPELIIILIIGLVLFGPGKLPDVGKALGKSIREFKSATVEPEKPEDKMVNVTEQPKEISDRNDAQPKG